MPECHITKSGQDPIFDAGRIRANIAVQDARTEQQLTMYEQTVLTALEEVENALVASSREQRRRVQLADAVTTNQQEVALAAQHACGATPPHACLCVTARDWHRTVPAHLGPPAAHHTCPLDHATLPPPLPSSGTPWSRHCLHSCVRSSERLSRTSVPLCKRPRIARPRQATAES